MKILLKMFVIKLTKTFLNELCRLCRIILYCNAVAFVWSEPYNLLSQTHTKKLFILYLDVSLLSCTTTEWRKGANIAVNHQQSLCVPG